MTQIGVVKYYKFDSQNLPIRDEKENLNYYQLIIKFRTTVFRVKGNSTTGTKQNHHLRGIQYKLLLKVYLYMCVVKVNHVENFLSYMGRIRESVYFSKHMKKD